MIEKQGDGRFKLQFLFLFFSFLFILIFIFQSNPFHFLIIPLKRRHGDLVVVEDGDGDPEALLGVKAFNNIPWELAEDCPLLWLLLLLLKLTHRFQRRDLIRGETFRRGVRGRIKADPPRLHGDRDRSRGELVADHGLAVLPHEAFGPHAVHQVNVLLDRHEEIVFNRFIYRIAQGSSF